MIFQTPTSMPETVVENPDAPIFPEELPATGVAGSMFLIILIGALLIAAGAIIAERAKMRKTWGK